MSDGRTFVLNQKLMSLGGDLWIDDYQGNHAFFVDGKAFTARDRHLLENLDGRPLYAISQVLARLHRTFEIKRADQLVATVQQEWTFLRPRFTVTSPTGDALEIQGDFLEREFRVTRAGTDVIRVTRKFLSLRDCYTIQVAPDFDTPFALAVIVALERMELQRHVSASSSDLF
jgi:uncharacterized protein YxjI